MRGLPPSLAPGLELSRLTLPFQPSLLHHVGKTLARGCTHRFALWDGLLFPFGPALLHHLGEPSPSGSRNATTLAGACCFRLFRTGRTATTTGRPGTKTFKSSNGLVEAITFPVEISEDLLNVHAYPFNDGWDYTLCGQLELLQVVCLQLPDLQCVYCPSGLHSQGRPPALCRRANVAFDCRRMARIRTPGVVLNRLIVPVRPKAVALWLDLYAPTAPPDQHSGCDHAVAAARNRRRGANSSADHA